MNVFNTEGKRFEYEFAADTANYFLQAIIVTDKGCRRTIDHPFRVYSENIIYAPSAFTPNGDGVNETFSIKTLGIRTEGFKVWIFNRWGEELYSSDQLDFEWDGIYRAEEIQSGMYVWKIEYITVNNEERTESGKVYLLD